MSDEQRFKKALEMILRATEVPGCGSSDCSVSGMRATIAEAVLDGKIPSWGISPWYWVKEEK